LRMATDDRWVDSGYDVLAARSGAVPDTWRGLPRWSVPGWRGLVRRGAGPLGGCGDVAELPAEYQAV